MQNRTPKPACLSSVFLLTFSANTFAINTQEEYIDAINNGQTIMTVQQPGLFLTAGIPDHTAHGLHLRGQWNPGDPLVQLQGNGTQRALTSSASLASVRGLEILNFSSTGSGGGLYTDRFVGDLSDSAFTGNHADGNGGGLRVGGAWADPNAVFIGNIENATFVHNSAGERGGAVAVVNTFQGSIKNSKFIGNTAVQGGGAVAITHMIGSIEDSDFIGNIADDLGGAFYVHTGDVTIRNTRFLGNIGKAHGGAITMVQDSNATLKFEDAVFIRNEAQGAEPSLITPSVSPGGGAMVVRGDFSVANSQFLGNRAHSHGAAILHARKSSDYKVHDISISATAGKATRFYGNLETDTGQYSALHLNSSGRVNIVTNMNIHAEADSAVLMFDAINDKVHRTNPKNEQVNIRKTGAGDWVLGGASALVMDYDWDIQQGAFNLATVDYGAATPPVATAIDMSQSVKSSFTLQQGAALGGSGSITAKTISLKGDIRPAVWVNTGIRANDISTAMTDAQIHGIQASQASLFGTLAFVGDVDMAGASYHVDLGAHGGAHDQLVIDGALKVTAASTVNINSWSDTTPVLDDGTPHPTARVIRTTGGIAGAHLLDVHVGGASSVDFLHGIQGSVDASGKHFDVQAGLRWVSQLQDASGAADAHGNFTVADIFTLNANLSNQSAFATNPTAHGWTGDTLTKKGAGTLVLNGANTYTGLTTVEAGALHVGDSSTAATAQIAGDVQVDAGAVLSGTGRIQGKVDVAGRLQGTTSIEGHVKMLAGSVLSPGFSIGTQTVGSIAFDPTSVFDVQINPFGGSDKLKVEVINGSSGQADLGGATLILRNDGDAGVGNWALNTDYTIVETDNGVINQFGTVQNTFAFLDPTVDYATDPNKVFLRMRRNATLFGAICATANQCASGTGLDSVERFNPADPLVQAVLGLTPNQARAAYDNLSGEIYASTRAALIDDRHLRTAVNRRMLGQAGDGSRLWVESWGQGGHEKGDANVSKTDTRGFGLVLGADASLTTNLTVGGFFAYEDQRLKQGNARNARSDVDAYSVGAYAATNAGSFELRGGVGYSRLSIDTRRDIAVGALRGQAKSTQKGHKTQVFVEAARPFAVSETATLAPYVNLAQVWLRTKAATESGNVAALDIARQTDSVRVATLGVRAAVALPTQTPLQLTAELGWSRAFGDVDSKTSNRFAGRGSRFEIQGVDIDKNAAVAGVGVQALLAPATSVSVGYQGALGSRVKSHTGQVQLKMTF